MKASARRLYSGRFSAINYNELNSRIERLEQGATIITATNTQLIKRITDIEKAQEKAREMINGKNYRLQKGGVIDVTFGRQMVKNKDEEALAKAQRLVERSRKKQEREAQKAAKEAEKQLKQEARQFRAAGSK